MMKFPNPDMRFVMSKMGYQSKDESFILLASSSQSVIGHRANVMRSCYLALVRGFGTADIFKIYP